MHIPYNLKWWHEHRAILSSKRWTCQGHHPYIEKVPKKGRKIIHHKRGKRKELTTKKVVPSKHKVHRQRSINPLYISQLHRPILTSFVNTLLHCFSLPHILAEFPYNPGLYFPICFTFFEKSIILKKFQGKTEIFSTSDPFSMLFSPSPLKAEH